MTVFILLVLVLIGVAAVAYPLFRRGGYIVVAEQEEIRNLEAQKESYYRNIKELEFDYRAEKLSRRDYELIRDEYKMLAAETIARIDSMKGRGRQKTDDWIEQEVRRIREAKKRSKSGTPR